MRYKAGYFKPDSDKLKIWAEFEKESHAKMFLTSLELNVLSSYVYFYVDTETNKPVFYSECKFSDNISELKYYDCEADKERMLNDSDVPKQIIESE